MTCTNICIIGVPEAEEREKGPEHITKTSLTWERNHSLKSRKHNEYNRKQTEGGTTPRHIFMKLTKIKDKQKMLKAAREKKHIT